MFSNIVVYWLFMVFVAILLFILFSWFIPIAFGWINIPIPELIARVLSLLIVAFWLFGGYRYRGARPPVA